MLYPPEMSIGGRWGGFTEGGMGKRKKVLSLRKKQEEQRVIASSPSERDEPSL
jgi:hypothetical protein